MKLQLNASKIVGLFAFAALMISTGVIKWNRDAGHFVSPPEASPISLELDKRTSLDIYLYDKCETHQFWMVHESGERVESFSDRLPLGHDHGCRTKTGTLQGGKWTIHSNPQGIYASVYEGGIFTSKYLREWFYGHVQTVSLVILLLVGLRVAFQKIMKWRKASKKVE